MEDICGTKTPYLTTAQLETQHARCMDKAMCIFQNKRKMGGDAFSQTYMKKLSQARNYCNSIYLLCFVL